MRCGCAMASAVPGAEAKRVKLRIRVADSSMRCKVDVSGACTLRQLKATIGAELGISVVEVSLNKQVHYLDCIMPLTPVSATTVRFFTRAFRRAAAGPFARCCMLHHMSVEAQLLPIIAAVTARAVTSSQSPALP